MNLPYNKKIIKMGSMLILFVSGITFIVGSGNLRNKNEPIKAQENVETCEVPKDIFSAKKEEKLKQTQNTSDFIIKEYNGSVAVFESGKNSPFKTTETMVSDLPTADRELLKKGISVGSREELSRILEDYCS